MKKDYSQLDPYEILNLDADASSSEIKRAYRMLAKKWHPDRNKSPNAAEMFKKISWAYEKLSGKRDFDDTLDKERKWKRNLYKEIKDFIVFPDEINEKDMGIIARSIDYKEKLLNVVFDLRTSPFDEKSRSSLGNKVSKDIYFGGHYFLDFIYITNGEMALYLYIENLSVDIKEYTFNSRKGKWVLRK